MCENRTVKMFYLGAHYWITEVICSITVKKSAISDYDGYYCISFPPPEEKHFLYIFLQGEFEELLFFLTYFLNTASNRNAQVSLCTKEITYALQAYLSLMTVLILLNSIYGVDANT